MRSAGSLGVCPRRPGPPCDSCRPSVRIRLVPSGRGCSRRAFSARSSVISRPACRTPPHPLSLRRRHPADTERRPLLRGIRALRRPSLSAPEQPRSRRESYWWEFMRDTYATTQAVAVRRQADTMRGVASLAKLIEEISGDSSRVARNWWLSLGSDGPDDGIGAQFLRDNWDRHFAGTVCAHLDPALGRRIVMSSSPSARRSVSTWTSTWRTPRPLRRRSPWHQHELDAPKGVRKRLHNSLRLLSAEQPTP